MTEEELRVLLESWDYKTDATIYAARLQAEGIWNLGQIAHVKEADLAAILAGGEEHIARRHKVHASDMIAKAAERSAHEAPPGKRFKRIDILYPSKTGPYVRQQFGQVTVADIERIVALAGGVGLISESQMLQAAEEGMEEVVAQPVALTDIKDGGRYFVIRPYTTRDELEDWRLHIILSHEEEAAERAVIWLKEHGFPDARRVCVNVIKSSDPLIQVQIDGAAAGGNYVVIVDAKTFLTSSEVEKFVKMLANLRQLIDSGHPSTKDFKGKELLAVLSAHVVTTNVKDRARVMALCQQHGIEIWTVNGEGLATGSGCLQSPFVHNPKPSPVSAAVGAASTTATACLRSPHASSLHGGALVSPSRTAQRLVPVAPRPSAPRVVMPDAVGRARLPTRLRV